MSQNVLILATHPDDETLGAGGTLLKHIASEDRVTWLILTEMQECYSEEKKKVRRSEIEKVARAYGFAKTVSLPFRTTRLDTYPVGELTAAISSAVQEAKPDILYLPNRSDIHSDHRVAFEAGIACAKPFRHPFLKKVLMYETPSETDFAPPFSGDAFVPNVFVDITPYLEKKLKIMSLYESELAPHPFPRSLKGLEALALLRGGQAHVPHAEAFCLLREIL